MKSVKEEVVRSSLSFTRSLDLIYQSYNLADRWLIEEVNNGVALADIHQPNYPDHVMEAVQYDEELTQFFLTLYRQAAKLSKTTSYGHDGHILTLSTTPNNGVVYSSDSNSSR